MTKYCSCRCVPSARRIPTLLGDQIYVISGLVKMAGALRQETGKEWGNGAGQAPKSVPTNVWRQLELASYMPWEDTCNLTSTSVSVYLVSALERKPTTRITCEGQLGCGWSTLHTQREKGVPLSEGTKSSMRSFCLDGTPASASVHLTQWPPCPPSSFKVQHALHHTVI